MSRKALCIMIAVFLILAGITFGILFTIDKKTQEIGGEEVVEVAEEVFEEVKPVEIPKDDDLSWSESNCGSKLLLEVDITDKFETSTEACESNETPFSILGYRDEQIFYSGDLSGKRPIYVDELESNEALKAKVLEFLTEATSQRGINSETMYGLVNGWVDSTQVVNNCGSQQAIGKILATKSCYEIFKI